ncbi:hypothetical protein N0V82_005676 [Gnomoniopsis sp. IMI 355080]|nr:hypothetical protein N0V82_005676 [Gnomoniopsis sp. IMI 355080]
MSDARSLLRQQRAARRIQHPHVQYSAPGKLSCTICQEPIKSEALWDAHTRSVAHRQRLLASAKEPREPAVDADSAGVLGAQKSRSSTDTLSDEALLAQIIGGTGHKRKHNEHEEDVDMEDATQIDETVPAGKRSKPDLGSPTAPTSLSSLSTTTANGSPSAKPDSQQPDKDTERSKRPSTGGGTPPGLVRRISGTPSHGVELQIPSRPATPSASATSTPKATPMGRSPLIPPEGQMAGLPSATKSLPKAAFASSTGSKESTTTTTTPAPGKEEDDDDDWAAFESEVVHAPPASAKSTVTAAASYAGDAVIAAAPMTAQQIAAKQEEDERERRRAQADVDLEDEKEEATRALETEFEEMEELEARVRKLKEKREAIRRGSVPTAAGATGPVDASGKSGVAVTTGTAAEQHTNGSAEAKDEDEDEDEDDEEDEDDWAGFRFRA